MATYAIGDVQGCFDQLQQLLQAIDFQTPRDTLWLTGDLVNRGPRSLEVLRFVRELGEHAITVLGNHDLHTLAVACGHDKYKKKDTIDDVLEAPDRTELLDWLRHRPLFHHDDRLNFTLLHAGLVPQWDLPTAQRLAAEVETVLRGPEHYEFLERMYGNKPECWSEDLQGWPRLRFITNCMTRLRYCDSQGRLDLKAKGPPGTQPAPFLPWFEVPGRASANLRIIFGHWSTLDRIHAPGVYALDTGCVWGGSLTALCLDDGRLIEVPCPQTQAPALN